MNINEAINILKKIKEEKGNLEVMVAHPTIDDTDFSVPWIRADFDNNDDEMVIIE